MYCGISNRTRKTTSQKLCQYSPHAAPSVIKQFNMGTFPWHFLFHIHESLYAYFWCGVWVQNIKSRGHLSYYKADRKWKEIHLLWVAQCLGSLNHKVITDVLQNLLLTKYDGFYRFLWREGILFTQKYNSNFSVKLTSYNIRFTEPPYTVSHDIKSLRLATPLCYERTCSPHVKILFVS